MGTGLDLLNYYGGTAIIYDFAVGDSISISSEEELSSSMIQDGSDVVVSFGSAGKITLQNTNVNDLVTQNNLIKYGSNHLNLDGDDTIFADGSNATILTAGQGSSVYAYGSSIINAGAGNDMIVVENSSDISISMGAGSDRFYFNGGTALIHDFTEEDSINIGSLTISNSIQSGSDVIISFGDSDSITLQNTILETLLAYNGWITYRNLFGLEGDDSISVDGSHATILTAEYGSSVYAYGSNIINAGDGNDTIELFNGSNVSISMG